MEDKEELAEWQEAFRLFDKDGDGRINEGELGQLLHSLSQDASDVHKLMGGKNDLSMSDFVSVMQVKSRAESANSEVLAAFAVFDRDGKGYVSASEMKHYLATLGEPFDTDEVDEFVREAEVGDDGQINFVEFVRTKMSDW